MHCAHRIQWWGTNGSDLQILKFSIKVKNKLITGTKREYILFLIFALCVYTCVHSRERERARDVRVNTQQQVTSFYNFELMAKAHVHQDLWFEVTIAYCIASSAVMGVIL